MLVEGGIVACADQEISLVGWYRLLL